MATSRRKSASRRSNSASHKSRRKTTDSKKASIRRSKSPGHATSHRSVKHGDVGVTYVFECTGPGCGYRIVREEKAEVGQTRYDLKCPKCHNTEFKCQGPGDLPESIEMSIPISPIDFDRINPVDLGSSN